MAVQSLRRATGRSRVVPVGASLARCPDGPWLVGASALLAVLCGLPYLLSAFFGPAALERIGTFWFMRDYSQYEAAMREGASQAGWLIHDHFSAEPHTPALMYPLYVAAGKFGALTGVSNESVFVTLEWLGRFAVLGAVYLFARTFLASTAQRRLAVALALGTLGLDTLAALARVGLDGLGMRTIASILPDTINPYLEVSSFGALLSAPHLMLGLALTLLCAPVYLRAMDSIRWVPALALTVLALSLVHSFNTPVVASAVALHALLTGRRAWPAASAACLAAAPMALYSLLLYQTDPFWSGTYSVQNLMPSPAPWLLPLDFGLVLLAAPLAWPILRGWPTERRRLILLWVGTGLLWMYAPVPYQRRFAFGVQPALAVLAAVGLLHVNAWMTARRVARWRVRLVHYLVIVAAISTSLLVYFALVASAMTNKPAEVYLWTHAEAAAADWLSGHSTGSDVVLASTDFANPLAGEIDGRVVHGHIVATLHSDEKAALVTRFYGPTATASERSKILAETGATVVASGPRERELGASNLSSQPELALVYDEDEVQLYRVNP
jgi:hypothetical protein